MDDKITLKEFWNSKFCLAINCRTQEQSDKLMKEFDKMGKRWASGERYVDSNVWNEHCIDTCYDNGNGYDNIDSYLADDYKVFQFKDVIFEEEKEKKVKKLTAKKKEYIKVGNLLFKKEDFKYAETDEGELKVTLNDGTELITYSKKNEEALKKLDYVYKKLEEI